MRAARAATVILSMTCGCRVGARTPPAERVGPRDPAQTEQLRQTVAALETTLERAGVRALHHGAR
jgi:hypothetical protein